MEYRVTDIITLLNAEYKGEVIEKVSKLSPFFHSDEKSYDISYSIFHNSSSS